MPGKFQSEGGCTYKKFNTYSPFMTSHTWMKFGDRRKAVGVGHMKTLTNSARGEYIQAMIVCTSSSNYASFTFHLNLFYPFCQYVT